MSRPGTLATATTAAAAAAALLLAVPASAYVRSTNTGGTPIAWRRTSLRLVESEALLKDLPIDQTRAAIRQAMAAWSYPTVPCTALQLDLTLGFGSPPKVAPDLLSYIIFREDNWCDGATCHDASQLALTTVFAKSRPGQPDDGEIIDVDLEINAFDHRWTNIPDSGVNPVPGARDLANLLTHELGHFLGLSEVCGVTAGGMPARDHLGNPVPDCSSASAEQRAATMFPDSPTDDISKRTLADDDVMGVCAIYPRMAGATDDAAVVGSDAGMAGGATGADDAGSLKPDAARTAIPQPMVSIGGCSCRAGAGSGSGSILAYGGLGLLAVVALGRGQRRSAQKSRTSS